MISSANSGVQRKPYSKEDNNITVKLRLVISLEFYVNGSDQIFFVQKLLIHNEIESERIMPILSHLYDYSKQKLNMNNLWTYLNTHAPRESPRNAWNPN